MTKKADGTALAHCPGMSEIITIHPQAEPLYSEPSLSPYQARQAKAPDNSNDDFFGSFADILDVINPLQHIPGVATAYRELTGDKISSGARILGGTLFGGPLGFIFALANEVIQENTGKDIGANMFAAVTDKYEKTNQLG